MKEKQVINKRIEFVAYQATMRKRKPAILYLQYRKGGFLHEKQYY